MKAIALLVTETIEHEGIFSVVFFDFFSIGICVKIFMNTHAVHAAGGRGGNV